MPMITRVHDFNLITEIPEKTEKIGFSMNNFRPGSVKITNNPLFLLIQRYSGLISERNDGSDEEID